MRVALVHDWLIAMRGGERVLEQLALMFPDADIFTLLCRPDALSPALRTRRIITAALSSLPGARSYYRYTLPLMPYWIEQFDLRGYDLVISSSHCVAKGIRVPAGVPHLCYCHSPMRYLYDQAEVYRQRFGWGVRSGFALFRNRLRSWDRNNAQRVTRFIANSEHVQQRIRNCYGRAADVVYPPVGVDRFSIDSDRADYYITVSALVPYKRVELIVQAFNTLGRRLVVVGSGPERRALARIARNNVEFTGWIEDAEVERLVARARGFVFAGVEDFGISLVEAQAAGTPVIAYAGGGALESVVPGETGLLYHEPTASALVAAVEAAEKRSFAPAALRRNAERFRPEQFRTAMQQQIQQAWDAALHPVAV